jgi:L-cysteine:1D-myo-inositol 2-amino-2-deoxy-alpha-D-glucopyranoside ligase
VLQGLRERLSDDLDSPGAIALVDDWAARTLAAGPDDDHDDGAPRVVADAVDALLGVALDPALDRCAGGRAPDSATDGPAPRSR